MTEKTRKLRFIDENRTKGLQKDWQGYGKSQALFGIVVLMIFLLAFVYHFVMYMQKLTEIIEKKYLKRY